MRDKQRYIFLSTGIREHWIWENATYFQWWIDLLLMAAWKGYETVIKKKIVQIKRGQLVASIRFLRKRWAYLIEGNKKHKKVPSNTRVLEFLKLLEKENMIRKQKKYYGTLITICNYDRYQSDFDRMRNDSGNDSRNDSRNDSGNDSRNKEYTSIEGTEGIEGIEEKRSNRKILKFLEIPLFAHEYKLMKDAMLDESWMEVACMQTSLKKEQVREYLVKFCFDSYARNFKHNSSYVFRDKFIIWCKIETKNDKHSKILNLKEKYYERDNTFRKRGRFDFNSVTDPDAYDTKFT